MSCFQILPLFLLVISTLGSARYYDLVTAKQYYTKFTNKFGVSEVKMELFDKDPDPVPDQIDYRKQGLVTPVKTKMAEADSSFYAIVETIEGLYAAKTGKLVLLSVNQIIDCKNISNPTPFRLTMAMFKFGSESEADYGNETHPGVCHYDKNKVIVVPTVALLTNPRNDIHIMKRILNYNGAPMAIVLSMSPSMLNYKGDGVLTPTDCDAPEPNIFYALLVGYDKESATGKEYWIIKTSLGPQYGDKGYLNLDVQSPCFMMDSGASTAYVVPIDY